jgi:hypothetical protein
VLRWRRHEVGVSGTGSTEPVLAPAELSGLFICSPPALEQLVVYLAQQTVRERESPVQSNHAVLEGGDVARDLDHIVERNSGRFVKLEEKQV